MLKAPPKRQLSKLFRKKVTLTKYTLSNGEDAYGQRRQTIKDTYTLFAEIQEITSEDIAYLVPGTANIGDAYGYFLPNYLVKGQVISIEVEDEVTWNNKTWRIERIEDFLFGEKLYYKRAFLKRRL